MQQLVADALRIWDVPGVAIAVVSRDEVLWLHGHGLADLPSKRPLTHGSMFPIASCTKAFTATLIAMLAEGGKLRWDDPVRKHDPEFRLADPWASDAATFRDLLCHRTGLASHDYLWYRATWTPEEAVRRAGLLKSDRPFRTSFQYQSTMVAAAGFVAARTVGERWESAVESRIFKPLGMTRARCTSPPESVDRASPHRTDRDGKLRVLPYYDQPHPDPAGSIHVSANDLVPWLQFQLGDGEFRGRRLLANASLRESQTPQVALRLEGLHKAAAPETLMMSYGLGWVVQDYRGQLVVSHAGAIDGFRAHITLLPNSGLGFALLCNRHQSRMNWALNNILIDRLLGLPPRDWHAYYRDLAAREESARTAKLPADDIAPARPLADYAGRYTHPAYGDAIVRLSEGSLTWQWSGFRGLLRVAGKDSFLIEDENLADNDVRFTVAETRVAGFEFLNLPFVRE